MTIARITMIFLLAGFFCVYKLQAQKTGYKTAPSDARAVFQVDYPYPTSDKPQSKLWYQDDCWWALLPRSGGPSLWQRTVKGWKEHQEVNRLLQGVPGRADVWYDKDGVTAVGVLPDSLVIFRLTGKKTPGEWDAKKLAALTLTKKANIETATIARDSSGDWWVAADGDSSVYVWHSKDGRNWSRSFLLKAGISKDDICTIAAINEGVIIIWSNQTEEAVQCRVHKNGDTWFNWSPESIVEKGNNTADDHLHAASSADGTLWVVTKNSVDLNGYPQLVLRVRHPSGSWKNYPYMPRGARLEPSRPFIVTTQAPGTILAGHTIYDKEEPYRDYIESGVIDTLQSAVLKNRKAAIPPRPAAMKSKINDCTTPKLPFPLKGPWIVLASDKEGRVYEADLRN